MKKFKIAALLFLAFLILSGCFPSFKFEPAYTKLHANEQEVAAVKRILVIGPDFEDFKDMVDENWIKSTKDVWHKEILAEFNKYNTMPAIYKLILSPEDIGSQIARIKSELGVEKISRFDTKTGGINKEYEQAMAKVFGRITEEYKVDGVAYLDFVVVYPEIKKIGANWDGQFESAVKANFGTMLFGAATGIRGYDTFNVSGNATALSLTVKMYNQNGTLLVDGRAGYKLLTFVDAGLFNVSNESLSLKEAFDEKYKKQRNTCALYAVNIILNPKSMEDTMKKFKKE